MDSDEEKSGNKKQDERDMREWTMTNKDKKEQKGPCKVCVVYATCSIICRKLTHYTQTEYDRKLRIIENVKTFGLVTGSIVLIIVVCGIMGGLLLSI